MGRTVINVSTDVISAVKDNVTYLFKPKTDISERGAYKVSKASNITNLPKYIQDQYSLLGNDVAITEDMTLTEDLGTLTGSDRDVAIYGNGHSLDLNFHNGVTVDVNQTLSFNNVTLKNSYALFDNSGTINLTSVVLNNTYANNSSSSLINFSGYNDFIEGVITSDGKVHLQSGTTNIRENFTLLVHSIFLGKNNGTKSPIVTLNNYGYIRVANSLNFNNTNINNFGTLSLHNINGTSYKPTKIINHGTISMDSGRKFYVQQNSEFINNLGAILNGEIKNAGIITNEGKINNTIINFNKYRHDMPPYYGKLTSNIDNITGLIYQQGDGSEDSIFNITGGTINDAQKIKNYDGENGGIVNILGAVKSQVRLDNYRGKTYVKNGGELQIAGSETSKIFTTNDNVNFENGSTLNLRESTIPAGQKFSPDNLILAENDTLNLKMKDGLTLNVTDSSAKGKFNLQELEIKDGSLQNWKLINDDNNSDIYGRTFLDYDLKLIKTASSASGVNFVTYDNSVGNISYKTKDLQSALDEVKYVNKGNDYWYEMSGQESAIGDFSNGRFIVNGNNKTISNSDISIDGTGTLVLTNANLKDTTLATSVNGQLVIRNNSGGAINLDNTTILNGSNNSNSSVRFEGNSDINFNGKYKGMYPSETVALDLKNATLTRSDNDSHAFWLLNSGTLKYANDSYLANGGRNAITFNGGNLDLRNGVASNI